MRTCSCIGLDKEGRKRSKYEQYPHSMLIPLSPELARICADITGDGHLQLQGWRGLVSFYSKKIEHIQSMDERFQKLFGVKGRVYVDNRYGRTRYQLFFISQQAAKFLAHAGVPAGNKTNQPFNVPNWIFKGTNKIQQAYLCGIFTAEGSVFSTRKNNGVRWRIGIEMYKSLQYKHEGLSYMNQLKQMLERRDIHCSPARFGRKNQRKDGSYSIATKLDIEASSFPQFYQNVGFDDKEKTEKLFQQVNSLKKS